MGHKEKRNGARMNGERRGMGHERMGNEEEWGTKRGNSLFTNSFFSYCFIHLSRFCLRICRRTGMGYEEECGTKE